MQGSLFVFFKRYIETKYDFETWLEVVKNSKTERTTYEMYGIYPPEDFHKLIKATSDISYVPVFKLLENFGEALVPDLLLIYNHYVNPQWKTMDVLANTEYVMHGAAKIQGAKASPPVLNITRINKNKLMLEYYSERRMGSLAIGIIKGIAKYYHEETNIVVESTTEPSDEHVKIVVGYID